MESEASEVEVPAEEHFQTRLSPGSDASAYPWHVARKTDLFGEGRQTRSDGRRRSESRLQGFPNAPLAEAKDAKCQKVKEADASNSRPTVGSLPVEQQDFYSSTFLTDRGLSLLSAVGRFPVLVDLTSAHPSGEHRTSTLAPVAFQVSDWILFCARETSRCDEPCDGAGGVQIPNLARGLSQTTQGLCGERRRVMVGRRSRCGELDPELWHGGSLRAVGGQHPRPCAPPRA